MLNFDEIDKCLRKNKIDFIVYCASERDHVTVDASDDIYKNNIRMLDNLSSFVSSECEIF